MHDDDRYTNLVWSQVCGIPLEALNGSERVFLDVLEWKVHVTKEVYDEMTRDIK
ncbi:hypothetical protein HDU79_011276 [Rhizoclosmatium sp. JEL0117]|nr:hypothetical protein HDU79_011276 [Rhizoclosmatium sp. JEL0117]